MISPLPAPDPDRDARDPKLPVPPSGDDLGFALPEPAKLTRARALALGAAVVVVLAALFIARWVPMQRARQELARGAKATEGAKPRVQVIQPVVISSDRSIALPGSVQPLEETVLYPRTNGYVRKWHADLGDKVKEGDLLAEIDTPELDQQIAQASAQLAQAEASLAQANANAIFSKASLERYRQMAPAGLASQQDLDKQQAQASVDQASIAVAEANVRAQRANGQLLGKLKSFSRIVAPFSGTITMRNVERGALVTSGTATPLFKIGVPDPVRVFTQMPQDVAPTVQLGTAATVTVREFPGRNFEGKVAHTAGALDPATRTMLTEVRVPNPKGELMTGMYARVSFTLPTPHRVFAVPAIAVRSDANGLRVAIVDAEGRVRFKAVVVERDTGPTIELASGISPGDRVVKLPSSELSEGLAVEVVEGAADSARPSGSAKP